MSDGRVVTRGLPRWTLGVTVWQMLEVRCLPPRPRRTQCALCQREGPLSDSHILPEFVYRPSYATTGRAVHIDSGRNRRSKRQKGFTERLLCDHCETTICRWETYFANAWLNPGSKLRPSLIRGDVVQITGLNYRLFKLFHLSLVWRAGVSSRREFDSVQLGAHERKLRGRLVDADPGSPYDYPILGMALRDRKSGGFMDGLVMMPRRHRIEGRYVYRCIFGGVLWQYTVSAHRAPDEPIALREDGTLWLPAEDAQQNDVVRALASVVRKAHGEA